MPDGDDDDVDVDDKDDDGRDVARRNGKNRVTRFCLNGCKLGPRNVSEEQRRGGRSIRESDDRKFGTSRQLSTGCTCHTSCSRSLVE